MQLRKLPDKMLQDIQQVLHDNHQKCIAVYAEAERIRRRWWHENIALEDVIAVFVERCSIYGVALAFDPGQAKEALLGEEG